MTATIAATGDGTHMAEINMDEINMDEINMAGISTDVMTTEAGNKVETNTVDRTI